MDGAARFDATGISGNRAIAMGVVGRAAGGYATASLSNFTTGKI